MDNSNTSVFLQGFVHVQCLCYGGFAPQEHFHVLYFKLSLKIEKFLGKHRELPWTRVRTSQAEFKCDKVGMIE